MFNPDRGKHRKSKEVRAVEQESEAKDWSEVARINDLISQAEQGFRAFSRFLKAAVLSAGISACAADSQEVVPAAFSPAPERSEQQYTSQDPEWLEKRERIVKTTLSKYFENPQEIIEKCGGIVLPEIVADNKDTPTIMHIGQWHGTMYDFRVDVQLSQHFVAECIIAMIDNNKTDQPLTVNFELIANAKEENMLELFWIELMQINAAEMLGTKIHSELSDMPGSEKFSYSVGDKSGGLPALLQIAKHYEPARTIEMLEKLPSSRVGKDEIDLGLVYQIAETLMHVVFDIQSKHNVVFDRADMYLQEAIELDTELEKMQAGGDGEPEAQQIENLLAVNQTIFDRTFSSREAIAFDKTLKSAKERNGLGVIVFGSTHDFRDEAYSEEVNLVRVETGSSHIAEENSTIDYRSVYSNTTEVLFSGLYKTDSKVLHQAMERLIEENPKQLFDHLINIQEYSFIIEHFGTLQGVLKLTNDDLFDIVQKSVEKGYVWHVRDNLKNIEAHLSPDQIAAVKEIVR